MQDKLVVDQVLPPVVDVEFSSYCNLKCGYCFGPVDDRSIPNLPTSFWMQALEWLPQFGVKGIVVSGGEPTMHPDIVPLLKHANNLGLSIVLSTHGRFRNQVLRCAPFTDWIALPIDGVSKEMLTEMRGSPWGWNEARSLIAEIREVNDKVKIKIGTVSTARNRHEIPSLGRALANSDTRIDTWKIYQYTPRRKFKDRAEEFALSNEEYSELSRAIECELPATPPFSVVFSSNDSRRQAYVFLYPDGTVAIPNVGKEMTDIIAGNLVKEGIAALHNVRGVFLDNHNRNYQSTYWEGER